MFKIIASDNLSEKGLKILRECEGIEINSCPGISHEELCEIIHEYDAILIRSGTTVTSEIIDKGKKLKLIGRAGVGVDNVDIAAASKRGIIVMNTPDGNTITTAEHTISMIMSLARKIPNAAASMASGKWEKKKFMGVEVQDKVIGIIGLGRIGRIIAKRTKGFGMKVIAKDDFTEDRTFENMGVKRVELDELFASSDFITVHTPLTPETKHIINKEAFSKMKKGVRIINCARGGIVNENDLCDAISEGIVAGAALDVFESEPPSHDNKILDMDEVVCTPHLGASTHEAQENVSINIAEQAIEYLINGVVTNSVNVASVTKSMSRVIKPFEEISEKIGKLSGQMAGGKIKEVSLKYYVKEYPEFPSSILKSFVLKGILEAIGSDREINWISAPAVAADMGITYSEEKLSSSNNYSNLVECDIKTEERSFTISGAVMHNQNVRIVRIEKFDIEMLPKGNILIFFNNDRPSIIGNIGKYLGENGVNINNMHFGRNSAGGDAVTIFGIDTKVSEDMLTALSKVQDIQRVAHVEL